MQAFPLSLPIRLKSRLIKFLLPTLVLLSNSRSLPLGHATVEDVSIKEELGYKALNQAA